MAMPTKDEFLNKKCARLKNVYTTIHTAETILSLIDQVLSLIEDKFGWVFKNMFI